ncbi:MAG: hypothetical protein HYZ52_04260 [Candidatus Omnitrophica bacterium]|nr:hypothetical protein [Candidatus Omnitrophota bacterium]
MFSRLNAQIEFLKKENHADNIAFLDSDMLVNADLNEVMNGNFDLALTYRHRDEESKRRELLINGGVILVKGTGLPSALAFLEKVRDTYRLRHADKLGWWGDQYALIDVVGAENIPAGGEKNLTLDGVNLRLLPCETYNFSPGKGLPLESELKNKKIIHFKGRTKKWILPAGLQKKTALLRSWYWQLMQTLKKDFTLGRLLHGQRVLIVGSGPSASVISHIPPDVRVLTCNAGMQVLLDKGLEPRVDLWFIIRSKNDKMLTVNGCSATKKKWIDALAQQSRARAIVTNDPSYILMQGAYRGRYKHLFWDGGRDPRYLNRLIRPERVEMIRGRSSVPATSSGLRLLQYALYHGAREIYLAGIDFGRNGYAWGPNANPWKHDDIDENFIKIVSRKHYHVFCLSETSQLAAYIPVKHLS